MRPTRFRRASGSRAARKPYFEVLVVHPGERSAWSETRESIRRLRRDTDEFVYEPVVVGSFEDAALAAIVNYNLQAVVIFDGFPYPSQHAVPDLRELLTAHVSHEVTAGADLGTALARVLRAYRPELDLYLVTDRNVAQLAGSDEAACIRQGVLRLRGDAGDPPRRSSRESPSATPRPTSTI